MNRVKSIDFTWDFYLCFFSLHKNMPNSVHNYLAKLIDFTWDHSVEVRVQNLVYGSGGVCAHA